MSIGITGGLGLIGKALRMKLDESVLILARRSPLILKANEKLIVGNFSDKNISQLFVKDINVLVHAAAGIGPRSEFEDRFIKDDLIGTIKLAKEFFLKNPKGHFIFLSTAGGLYDLENSSAKTEETEVAPKSLYGAVKLLTEDALANLKNVEGRISILRPSAVYGDSFKENLTVGLIDKLLKSTINENGSVPVSIFDKIDSARDYLHVDDLTNAIHALIISNSNEHYAIYNVGTGVETSIEEVINLINSISGNKVQVTFLPTPNKRTSLIVNSDKLKQLTGWESKISLKDGILKMYQDLKKNNNNM